MVNLSHLNESQRAMIAAKIADIQVGSTGGRGRIDSANLQSQTSAEAARQLSVSERSVNTAKKVQRAMVAANISNLPHGGDRKADQTANLQLDTRAEAASKLNVSERSVNTAKKVQRAMVAANISNLEVGEAGNARSSANLQTNSRAQAADKLNVSERSVNTAKKVRRLA